MKKIVITPLMTVIGIIILLGTCLAFAGGFPTRLNLGQFLDAGWLSIKPGASMTNLNLVGITTGNIAASTYGVTNNLVVLVEGDSWSDNSFNPNNWTEYLRTNYLKGMNIVCWSNKAVAGQNTHDKTNRFSTIVPPVAAFLSSTNVGIAILEIGINDSNQYDVTGLKPTTTPAESFAATYNWATNTRARGFKTIGFVVPPTGSASSESLSTFNWRNEYNGLLLASSNLFDTFIDARLVFKSPTNSLIFSNDTLHPTLVGGRLLAKIGAEAISDLLSGRVPKPVAPTEADNRDNLHLNNIPNLAVPGGMTVPAGAGATIMSTGFATNFNSMILVRGWRADPMATGTNLYSIIAYQDGPAASQQGISFWRNEPTFSSNYIFFKMAWDGTLFVNRINQNGFTNGQSILISKNTRTAVTGTVTETTLATFTIPANAMGSNGVLRVTWQGTNTNNGNNKTFRIKFGGSAIFTKVVSTSATIQDLRVISNSNNPASQLFFSGGSPLGVSANNEVALSVDTTANSTLAFTGELANTGDAMAISTVLIEIIHMD